MANTYTIKHETLQGIADAIKTKRGDDESIYVDEMAQEILNLDNSGGGGGGTENENKIIDGTIVNCINDSVTAVCDYAFYSRSNLTTVSFLACTTIGLRAFVACFSLTTASFPACTTIGY